MITSTPTTSSGDGGDGGVDSSPLSPPINSSPPPPPPTSHVRSSLLHTRSCTASSEEHSEEKEREASGIDSLLDFSSASRGGDADGEEIGMRVEDGQRGPEEQDLKDEEEDAEEESGEEEYIEVVDGDDDVAAMHVIYEEDRDAETAIFDSPPGTDYFLGASYPNTTTTFSTMGGAPPLAYHPAYLTRKGGAGADGLATSKEVVSGIIGGGAVTPTLIIVGGGGNKGAHVSRSGERRNILLKGAHQKGGLPSRTATSSHYVSAADVAAATPSAARPRFVAKLRSPTAPSTTGAVAHLKEEDEHMLQADSPPKLTPEKGKQEQETRRMRRPSPKYQNSPQQQHLPSSLLLQNTPTQGSSSAIPTSYPPASNGGKNDADQEQQPLIKTVRPDLALASSTNTNSNDFKSKQQPTKTARSSVAHYPKLSFAQASRLRAAMRSTSRTSPYSHPYSSTTAAAPAISSSHSVPSPSLSSQKRRAAPSTSTTSKGSSSFSTSTSHRQSHRSAAAPAALRGDWLCPECRVAFKRLDLFANHFDACVMAAVEAEAQALFGHSHHQHQLQQQQQQQQQQQYQQNKLPTTFLVMEEKQGASGGSGGMLSYAGAGRVKKGVGLGTRKGGGGPVWNSGQLAAGTRNPQSSGSSNRSYPHLYSQLVEVPPVAELASHSAAAAGGGEMRGGRHHQPRSIHMVDDYSGGGAGGGALEVNFPTAAVSNGRVLQPKHGAGAPMLYSNYHPSNPSNFVSPSYLPQSRNKKKRGSSVLMPPPSTVVTAVPVPLYHQDGAAPNLGDGRLDSRGHYEGGHITGGGGGGGGMNGDDDAVGQQNNMEGSDIEIVMVADDEEEFGCGNGSAAAPDDDDDEIPQLEYEGRTVTPPIYEEVMVNDGGGGMQSHRSVGEQRLEGVTVHTIHPPNSSSQFYYTTDSYPVGRTTARQRQQSIGGHGQHQMVKMVVDSSRQKHSLLRCVGSSGNVLIKIEPAISSMQAIEAIKTVDNNNQSASTITQKWMASAAKSSSTSTSSFNDHPTALNNSDAAAVSYHTTGPQPDHGYGIPNHPHNGHHPTTGSPPQLVAEEVAPNHSPPPPPMDMPPKLEAEGVASTPCFPINHHHHEDWHRQEEMEVEEEGISNSPLLLGEVGTSGDNSMTMVMEEEGGAWGLESDNGGACGGRTSGGAAAAKMECPTCGTCLYRHNFSTHYRIHTGELPYPCNYCVKKFRTSSALKVHHRSHTGEKPYRCMDCDYACITKRNLDRHIYNKHFERSPPLLPLGHTVVIVGNHHHHERSYQPQLNSSKHFSGRRRGVQLAEHHAPPLHPPSFYHLQNNRQNGSSVILHSEHLVTSDSIDDVSSPATGHDIATAAATETTMISLCSPSNINSGEEGCSPPIIFHATSPDEWVVQQPQQQPSDNEQ